MVVVVIVVMRVTMVTPGRSLAESTVRANVVVICGVSYSVSRLYMA